MQAASSTSGLHSPYRSSLQASKSRDTPPPPSKTLREKISAQAPLPSVQSSTRQSFKRGDIRLGASGLNLAEHKQQLLPLPSRQRLASHPKRSGPPPTVTVFRKQRSESLCDVVRVHASSSHLAELSQCLLPQRPFLT